MIKIISGTFAHECKLVEEVQKHEGGAGFHCLLGSRIITMMK
jgi:hypothetical protein